MPQITKNSKPKEATLTPVANGEATGLKERCDRCGKSAAAYIVATSSASNLPLYFCGHHGKKYHDGLVKAGFEIVSHAHLLDNSNEGFKGGVS